MARPPSPPSHVAISQLIVPILLACLAIRATAVEWPDKVDTVRQAAESNLFIVRMRAAPVAAQSLAVDGLSFFGASDASTAAGGVRPASRIGGLLGRRRPRFDARSPAVRTLVRWLEQQQERVAADVSLPKAQLLYRFRYVTNGFAARLSESQVRRLRRHPSVLDVRRSRRVYKQSTDTPTFLKLPGSLWAAAGGQSNAGAGVVVGIVDTGIWPEHPSFWDNTSTPYPAPPASWRGACQTSADLRACNRKLVGARFFVSGFRSDFGRESTSGDWLSPRDADGHGTWCAGAAAGNAGVNVTIARRQSAGVASGMAPRAHIAMYKVFWSNYASGGTTATFADVEAAVNQAVADGVDVLSLSLGGLDPSANYFDDLPYLYANTAGTVVVYAAGNEGPPPFSSSLYRSIGNFSPFYLTVGASTISRDHAATLTLNDGSRTTLSVSGYGGGSVPTTNLGIINAAAAKTSSVTTSRAQYCYSGTLLSSRVSEKMLVCVFGGASMETKVGEAVARGARVLLITGVPASSRTFLPYSTRIPVIYVDLAQANVLRSFLSTRTSPTGTLSSGYTTLSNATAPSMAYFTSSGPLANPSSTPSSSFPTNDVFKPDITAPGVSLWAAYRGSSTSSRTPQFAMISGTSMATPHVAGVAALLVQHKPTWTPSQVMSAIMTTASTTNNKGGPIAKAAGAPATPFDFGAGHVNAERLLSPGLTYSAGAMHYMNFLGGQNLAKARSMVSSQTVIKSLPAYNLNRPMIAVSRLRGAVNVTRWVVNVEEAEAMYTASVVAPSGVRVSVFPPSFTIAPGGTVVFKVEVRVLAASTSFRFGSLTWNDASGHSVRSVIAVQPLAVS